ncbi:hypothetical protein JX266_014306, partial [Neoarthrinium moseri]
MQLSPGDNCRRERRREQIRNSQRNFRERQKSRIATLQSRVVCLEAIVRAVEQLDSARDTLSYDKALQLFTKLVQNLEAEKDDMSSAISTRYGSVSGIAHHPATLNGQQLQLPAVHVALIERFIDYMCPHSALPQAKHHWVNDSQPQRAWRTGAELMSSELVYNAYLSAGARLTGQELGDDRLVHAADGLYSFVLRKLQKSIMDPIDTLLAHRGPQSCVAGVAHELFVESRIFWSWFSVINRSPTFLANTGWKTIPWSLNASRKDVLNNLVDRIVEIPNLLALENEINGMEKGKDYLALAARILIAAKAINQDLRTWKHTWTVLGHAVVSEKVVSADFIPVFEYIDGTTGDLVRPTVFMFHDAIAFQALCHYYGALLVVLMVQEKFCKDENVGEEMLLSDRLEA